MMLTRKTVATCVLTWGACLVCVMFIVTMRDIADQPHRVAQVSQPAPESVASVSSDELFGEYTLASRR